MTRSRLTLLAVALGAALAAPPADAQNRQVLTTAVPFLQIEPDSRAAGMGMTGVALADNAYAPFWNPAGLAEQDGAQVSFTYAPWLPALGTDLAYNYLTGVYGLGSAGTLGGHFTYFDLGEQIATDERGESLGTFSSYEIAAGVSYGYPVTENLSVGTGARFIYSNLTGGASLGPSTPVDAAASFGVDLGVKYTAPDIGLGESSRPSVAFNLANMGPRISYTENNDFPDAIPTTLRFGGALDTKIDEFNRIIVALDLNKVLVNGEVNEEGRLEFDPFYKALFSSWGSREVASTFDPEGRTCDERREDPEAPQCETISALKSLTLGAGLEYWYNDLLALRGGYFYEDPANGNRQFLTLGTGIRYSLVGVDISYIYALEEESPQSNQLRFSLLLNIPR
ncbi:type IX secretion system outer membrane channel protein PorV [Rubrivirga sp. S365]|uniref:Type IX secretion system outer membrane channel protein PorV n=1 Tax=Rubrivirga litoralis TaxID=3075598 RepID=A0ABU3BMH5_9BACT|nr:MULTISPECIES: type IX secretion system outer membrane channel protein PorV [unclassified Rubrivirga]MDT0630489.1 type IX secretion system outer membrane channel protein PorV [Rubrivirga sp. F394]MDT7857533.1 type IX secretion system outer membrane channel protein PorV [Rubrivirga sp. S365]